MTSMPNANAAEVVAILPASPALRVRLRKTALFAALIGAFGGLLASAHVPCGFAFVFHTPCPGCGSTRAMLALAHGDLAGYVRFNPLAALMTLILVVLVGSTFHSLLTTGTYREVASGRLGVLLSRGAVVVALLEFLVWIARFAGFLGGPVPV